MQNLNAKLTKVELSILISKNSEVGDLSRG